MGLGELFVIAVGLSMDAFAVSICKESVRGMYCVQEFTLVVFR